MSKKGVGFGLAKEHDLRTKKLIRRKVRLYVHVYPSTMMQGFLISVSILVISRSVVLRIIYEIDKIDKNYLKYVQSFRNHIYQE